VSFGLVNVPVTLCLLAFIRKKATWGEMETVEAPKRPVRRTGAVVDVMTLFKRSVDQAETGRRHGRRVRELI